MKKVRKIGVVVTMVIAICMTLTACGSKKENVYYTLTEEQFNQLMEAVGQQGNDKISQEAQGTAEEPKDNETALEKVEEKVLRVTITENDQKQNMVEPKVYDSMYGVTSNNPKRLNGEGTLSILLFDVTVKNVTVTDEKSGYSTYKELTAKNNGGYYSVSYEISKGTRVVFKVVTDTNKEYFFSLKC